jgi:hypothetical protein
LTAWQCPHHATFYAGGNPPATRPYQDYLAWLAAHDPAAGEAAWSAALAGVEEPTLVAPDATGAVVPQVAEAFLPADVNAALTAVARAHGARVVPEPRRGVCQARQTGVDAARGEIIASTDADSAVSPDWLRRLDAAFRADPSLVAVAGPCRYTDPPWWAAVFPPAFFVVVDRLHARTGHLLYLTATNVAFRREGFPGYDVRLTQGGDEVDLRRRLQAWGPVAWDARNAVRTSSRRMDFGLAHTLVVSFGYHYGLNYALARLLPRPPLGPAPAIRTGQAVAARRWRQGWRVVVLTGLTLLVTRAVRRR